MIKTSFVFAAFIGAASAAGAGDWNYMKEGADWGEDTDLCAFGKEQSPIDLSSAVALRSDKLSLSGYGYKNLATAKATTNANGVTVSTPADNGTLRLNFHDGSHGNFSMAQFHWHAPSEHTVDQKHYDLEMHMVHTYENDGTQYGAVIGIFFDRQAGGNYDNPLLTEVHKSTFAIGDTPISGGV